ncbi:MAG: hypothetical protein ABIP49_02440, partial [Lysobacterales bacterium]
IVAAFVPSVAEHPWFGDNRPLFFMMVRTLIRAAHPPEGNGPRPPVLAVTEHAIERLFQRMNVVSSATVEDELHEALLVAIPALSAALKLNFQQIVLPTKSGFLLCQIYRENPQYDFVSAKTWIASSPDVSRNADAGAALVSLYQAIGGQMAVAEYLATLPLSQGDLNIPIPDEACDALRKCTWLQDPYSPRDDPVGETWRLANSRRDQPGEVDGS